MTKILNDILGFFMQYPTQLFGAGLVFFVSLKRRENFWVRIIFTATAFLMLPYINRALSIHLRTGWFMWSFLIEFLLLMLLSYYCFDVTWKENLYYGTAVYAMQHFVNAIVFSLAEVMRGNFTLYAAVTLAAHIICYGAFYLILGRQVRKNRGEDLLAVKNAYVLIISAVTVAVVYLLSMWALVNHVNYITRLYAMCCCLLLLFIQFGVLRFFRKDEEVKKIKQLLSMEHEQHLMNKESIELINMKCHDLKHQIAGLRKLAENDNLEKMLGEVEEKVMIYDSTVQTGNRTLDIVLTEKKLYCEKYDIKFSCIIDGRRLSFVSDEDICSLFGNILDNAIESVKSLPEADKRVISLNVAVRGGMLIIHADNYCDRELRFNDGLPVTTKDNRNFHGYGMLSIRYLVAKYGGTMSVKLIDRIFNLNVLIPLAAETPAKSRTA